MRFLSIVFSIAFMLAFYPHASVAKDDTPHDLVQKAQQHLNQIQNMQTRFLITGPDGSTTTGAFYLKRPGKLRFEYDNFGDYIVADGLMVHMWDDAAKQASQAPIGSTLADFILKKDITFDGEVTVTGAKMVQDEHIAITLVQTKDPGAGEMTMLFATDPMKLIKWRVVDPMGQITETSLAEHSYPDRMDPTLFVFKAPEGHGEVWQDR